MLHVAVCSLWCVSQHVCTAHEAAVDVELLLTAVLCSSPLESGEIAPSSRASEHHHRRWVRGKGALEQGLRPRCCWGWEWAGLWQGMPSASQGARGLCTACQRLKSYWAADPRASLRERTHFVRTQENFPQFFTLLSVLFNFSEFVFFWRKCWAHAWFIQNSPWHLEDDTGFLGFFEEKDAAVI